MPLIRQVHVDAVGSEVIGHGQFVIAMVAHLLHDLDTKIRGGQKTDDEVKKHSLPESTGLSERQTENIFSAYQTL